MKIEFQGGLQSRRDLIYLHFFTFVRASSIIHALIRRHTKKKNRPNPEPYESSTQREGPSVVLRLIICGRRLMCAHDGRSSTPILPHSATLFYTNERHNSSYVCIYYIDAVKRKKDSLFFPEGTDEEQYARRVDDIRKRRLMTFLTANATWWGEFFIFLYI